MRKEMEINHKPSFFKFSLKTRTIFNFLFSLFTIGIFSYFVTNNLIEIQIKKKEEFLESQIRVIKNNIQAQFFERYGDVIAFATSINLNSTKEEIVDHLNKYAQIYGIYDLIFITDMQGNLLATNDKDAKGNKIDTSSLYQMNFQNTEWYKNVVAKKFTEDKSKGLQGVFVENPHFEDEIQSIYKEKRLTSGFSTVIQDKMGKDIAIISNRANFSWVEDQLLNHHKETNDEIAHHMEYFILDNQGLVIGHFFQPQEDDKGNNDKYVGDFSIILKRNLVSEGLKSAINAVQKKSGTVIETVGKDKENYIISYGPIAGDRFLDSLNWSMMIKIDEKTAIKDENNLKYLSLGFYAIAILFFIILGWYLGHSISSKFSRNTNKLQETMSSLIDNNEKLTEITNQLTQASNAQAAAVSESSAALSQMSSLANQTLTNCKEATELSQKAVEKADDGRLSMEKMSSAMEAISHENERLQDITQIISEITTKTAVINDIVFKTRLLSFNASIEAARAGVHGRGFAVVAEEVGNLAQMSGDAAKEIQQLLSNSNKQVHDTLGSISDRVKVGSDFCTEALRKFKEISQDILAVGASSQNITNATHEQVMGIEQSYTAMKSFEENTRNITRSVDEINKSSKIMSKENNQLRYVYHDLSELVFGDRNHLNSFRELNERNDEEENNHLEDISGNDYKSESNNIREKFKKMFKEKI